jgi:HEPN domain-containing protein
MQPDLIIEVKAWFSKASNDLRAADLDLTADPPLLDDIAFHCQQAIEKSIKGFLVAKRKTFKKVHDLDELSRTAIECDVSLEPILQPAMELTVYATMYRYPSVEELTLNDLKDDLVLAKKVYGEILSRLPAEVNPAL